MPAALAAEEALFESMPTETGARQWLMWQGQKSLVVPRTFLRRPGLQKAVARSRQAGWPVFMRQTGGDVVPQGPGTLNISLAWVEEGSRGSSIIQGYAAICDPIRTVLGGSCGSVASAFCDGAFNIVINGRKLAGTAQRRRRKGPHTLVLAHALILVDEDIEAGVAATNDFLCSLGQTPGLRADAHVNATEALCDYALTPARLANRLFVHLAQSDLAPGMAA
ncbi:lipoate--protein ligase family protein [Blastomonas sp. UPD001]|uniref:lipoate--protein ligase family protein n=1 Tax=Blastomonas sp. UPD001 TaxID=2217673 RepID=UPI000E341227|nr:lipoate--protein ligase family protein [Blastomonas sp. UPD001]